MLKTRKGNERKEERGRNRKKKERGMKEREKDGRKQGRIIKTRKNVGQKDR